MMTSHQFTLVLSGVTDITPELADNLFTVTEGDIEFCVREGVAYVEFDRKAATLQEAIDTAIKQVESVSADIRVVRVESDAANTIAKINAQLTSVD